MCDSVERYGDGTVKTLIKAAIMYGIFGAPLIAGAVICGVFVNVYQYIMETLQIKFWWGWYVSKMYENLTEDLLDILNKKAKTLVGTRKRDNQKLNLSEKHYMYCFRLIRDKYNKQKDWTWIDNKDNFVTQ